MEYEITEVDHARVVHVAHEAWLAQPHSPTLDIDDLIQEAYIGLLFAMDSYDAEKGSSLRTHSFNRIYWSIKEAQRKVDFLTRPDRMRVRRAEDSKRLTEQRLQRRATVEEIADGAGRQIDDHARLREYCDPIERPLQEDGDGWGALATSTHPDQIESIEIADERRRMRPLYEAIGRLPGKMGQALSKIYFNEMTLKEAGESIGLTESRMSQLRSEGLLRLRVALKYSDLGINFDEE